MNNINFNYSYINAPEIKIDQRFSMEFKPVKRMPKNWKDELIITAKKIGKNKKPLYLCLSGGIDSEVMALAFINAEVPFKALTLKHKDGTNDHDISYAEDFCRKHQIEQIFVEFDPLTYYQKYLQEYRSVNIFRYLQILILETVEELGGIAVLGGGEQIYYTIKDQIHIKYDPGFVLPLEWCKKNKTIHYPYFHMHNSELLASYMQLELISMLLKNPFYFESHHFMSIEKILVYNGYWPQMERRAKYNGFEQFREQRRKVETELKMQNPDIVPLYISISRVKEQLGI